LVAVVVEVGQPQTTEIVVAVAVQAVLRLNTLLRGYYVY